MKLLLDENLPHQLRRELPGHDVFTVAYLGWNGIENGKLLAMAAQHGFDAVISNDRGLQYEQDVTSLPLPVVVILSPSNTIETLRRGIPDLLKLLLNLQSPGVYRIVID